MNRGSGGMKRAIILLCAVICAAGRDVQAMATWWPTTTDLKSMKSYINKLHVEQVSFYSQESADKNVFMERKGLLVKRDNPKGTVIVCHGYLSNKFESIYFRHLFPDYNVFAFDFRAHGEFAQGQRSTIGKEEAFDVIAAVEFLKLDKEIKAKPMYVYGFSMGAVSAIEAQAQRPDLFSAMILDCPYDSSDEAVKRALEQKLQISFWGKTFMLPGAEFFMKNMYNDVLQPITRWFFKLITNFNPKNVDTQFMRVEPMESIKKITIPCLFIHCKNDTKIPVAAIQALYTNSGSRMKQLWITPGQNHFGSYLDQPEWYWYKVNKFLERAKKRKVSKKLRAKVDDDCIVFRTEIKEMKGVQK